MARLPKMPSVVHDFRLSPINLTNCSSAPNRVGPKFRKRPQYYLLRYNPVASLSDLKEPIIILVHIQLTKSKYWVQLIYRWLVRNPGNGQDICLAPVP